MDDKVRRVTSDGMISRFAGTGRSCEPSVACGDGGPATQARLSNPAGLAIDRAGDLLIADSNDHEVRQVSPQGTITRVAGYGLGCGPVRACGDGDRPPAPGSASRSGWLWLRRATSTSPSSCSMTSGGSARPGRSAGSPALDAGAPTPAAAATEALQWQRRSTSRRRLP